MGYFSMLSFGFREVQSGHTANDISTDQKTHVVLEPSAAGGDVAYLKLSLPKLLISLPQN